MKQYILDRIAPDEYGCWIWTGSVNKVLGRPLAFIGHQQQVYAYRLSFEVFVGPIPEGLQINHHCDVPTCVNPDHLYAGTHADNMRDMAERGRVRTHNFRGEQLYNAYPDSVVDEVRERYRRGETQKDLAAEFGMAEGTLRRWVSGGGRDRTPIKRQRSACGTRAGYCSHQRRGEKPCAPCRAANTEYLRAYKAKRRGGAA